MNDLERGNIRYTTKQLKSAPFDRTIDGRVIEHTATGYSVLVNDITYTNLLVLNAVSLSTNDIVKIVVPNNQDSNMFILGKLG